MSLPLSIGTNCQKDCWCTRRDLKGDGFWIAGGFAYPCWCKQIAETVSVCTRIQMKELIHVLSCCPNTFPPQASHTANSWSQLGGRSR